MEFRFNAMMCFNFGNRFWSGPNQIATLATWSPTLIQMVMHVLSFLNNF